MPNCIGMILDGNRRWAREKNLPTLEGHKEGLLNTFKNIAEAVKKRGIKHLVAYMFSSENWNRSEEEVTYLMDLFRRAGREELKTLSKEGARIKFIGQKERFASDLQKTMDSLERESENNSEITLWLALSYGGRAEILNAAKKAFEKSKSEFDEKLFLSEFWSFGMPDPDIIIRTGGEKRLSNFLLWQCAYSELFFTDTLWPDFSEEELDAILKEYKKRDRRFGK